MRIGIIGLKGHYGECLHALPQIPDARIVAVSDDRPEAAAKFCRGNALADGAEAYTDWRHLVEHSMLDVCVVCDENHLRAEQIVALAQRNVHICAEKPLATTLAGLAQLKAAVAASQSKLTMLLVMRHMGKYARMHELIAKGAIGEPGMVTAQKSYRFGQRPAWQKTRERHGGTIAYVGIHALDLMQWVPNLKFARAAAFHANVARPDYGETEDTATVLVQYANGATGAARIDYLLPELYAVHGDDRLRIAGGEGVIEVQALQPKIMLTTQQKSTHTIDPGPDTNLFLDFAHWIREGRRPRMTADDAYSMTEFVLKARDAADHGEMVVL
jgi:predicted dehydrogenase